MEENNAVYICITGVKCFGPSAKAAEIEASKAFAKDFMIRYGIPTGRGKHFTSIEQAHHFIQRY